MLAAGEVSVVQSVARSLAASHCGPEEALVDQRVEEVEDSH